MAKAFHFSCKNCSYSFTGPLGHVHASRDQVVSVICTECNKVEARRVNWTQIMPAAENISENLDKLEIQHELKAQEGEHSVMENMLRAADNKMEWNDYSLQLEDIFVCWSCENELFVWDMPVCPCCGDKMKQDFAVSLDD